MIFLLFQVWGLEDGHILGLEDGHILELEDGHVLGVEDGHTPIFWLPLYLILRNLTGREQGACYMRVSNNQGPQYGPQDSRALLIRAPTK